jgi:hypothetical protein
MIVEQACFDLVQMLATPVLTMITAELLGIAPGEWRQFE